MATQQQISRAIDDIFSSTWYKVRPKVTDQVFQITPFWDLMMEKGKIKEKMPDGTHWEIPIVYDELNQNTKWFGRGDTFGTADKQIATNLLFTPKNLGTNVVRFWDDDRKNRGAAKIYSYVELKLNNTKSSLINTLENASWVQDPSALAMTALPTLISTTPTTGTVGGLARASNSWMTNQTINMSGQTILANLLANMRTMKNRCSKYKAGERKAPDIILCDQTTYEMFEAVAQSMQQVVTNKTERISLGFGDLLFKGIEIFWAPQCPSGTMYFLNTEHLMMPYDPQVYFEMTEWKPVVGNSLDKNAQIVLVAEMCIDNFQKQGVIYNIPSTLS